MGEAAGEALLQLTHLFLARSRILAVKIPIDRLPVLAHDVSHVFRALQTALDLERGDARFNQLRHQIDRGKIFWREQVGNVAHRLLLAIHDQIVRQTAGLRALSAIGGPAAPHFGSEALARVGYA